MNTKRIEASSMYRYRATAQERRTYGGCTVTDFWISIVGEPGTGRLVRGYGPTPGERKTDAIRRSGLV